MSFTIFDIVISPATLDSVDAAYTATAACHRRIRNSFSAAAEFYINFSIVVTRNIFVVVNIINNKRI